MTASNNIHPTAFVHETAEIGAGVQLGPDVHVGANTLLEDGVSLGAATRVAEWCLLAAGVQFGDGCRVMPGVEVRERAHAGDHVVVSNNAQIGAGALLGDWAYVRQSERIRAATYLMGMPPSAPEEREIRVATREVLGSAIGVLQALPEGVGVAPAEVLEQASVGPVERAGDAYAEAQRLVARVVTGRRNIGRRNAGRVLRACDNVRAGALARAISEAARA